MELPPIFPLTYAVGPYIRDFFTRFPRLPIEIRLRIWHLALQCSKILRVSCWDFIETKFRRRAEIQGTCDPVFASTFYLYKVPPLFHVCRESRYEAFKAYQLFDLMDGNKKINLNCAADIFLLNYPPGINSHRSDFMLYIQHVAFDLSTLVQGMMTIGSTLAFLQEFPILKTFTMFMDSTEKKATRSLAAWRVQSKADQNAKLAVGPSGDEMQEVRVSEDILRGLRRRHKELERGAHCPYHLYKRGWDLPEMRIIKLTWVGFWFHDFEIQDVEIGDQIWEKQGLAEEPCHCEHGRPMILFYE